MVKDMFLPLSAFTIDHDDDDHDDDDAGGGCGGGDSGFEKTKTTIYAIMSMFHPMYHLKWEVSRLQCLPVQWCKGCSDFLFATQ